MREIVVVGSENPSKLQAVRLGFEAVFPDKDFQFLCVNADSDVSAQPMGDAETVTGAQNRARNARVTQPEADYWVGLEGGLTSLESLPDQFIAYSWICVLTTQQKGLARSAAYVLPERISNLIKGGMEQGEADDIVFGQENSKHNSGGVGLLSNDLITRSQLYAMAVKLALIPFIKPELYPREL
ncbi:MAG TPA: inosine/xanthosine triphosphatase [Chloroflexi bacterium]|jgi:inosine/xanthosine triphosphatase|nr:inosine/xanthosine triphosphatase [Chloroflexota bacterium]